MQKSELEILKTSSLFRGMSDADINWLLSDERSVIRHFPKGAFIFKEFDRPGQVYVLLDGKVVCACPLLADSAVEADDTEPGFFETVLSKLGIYV